MFKKITYLIALLIHFSGSSQLLTAGGQSPAQLIQNVLLGPGVTVSNVTYQGAAAAIGSFTAAGTNLGINSGIILTTGTILNNGDGPQGPNNQPNSGLNNGAAGTSIFNTNLNLNLQTFNAGILSFDFVPYSDTVSFRYVFGSEEYPEYVGEPFNDIFAFFISGPGIPGGIQNMAQVPGNAGVISINNVNNGPTNSGPCQNCGFYVNNGTGSNSPFNSSTNFIQYDGFTRVMTATSRVQCGQTYRLQIAIADVADPIWDSGIFLEANSLTSKTPVEISYTLSQQAFQDPNVLAEGCVSATVTLSRAGNISVPLSIPLSVAGTATAGVDYSNIPSTINFASGQATAQFTFSALGDALTEGLETLILNFLMTDPCGNQTPIVINLGINDLQPVGLTLIDTTVLCANDIVVIPSFPTGGVGPYSYNWNTGETSASITVNPAVTTTYSLTITDDCLNQSATASVTVTVPIYAPIALTATPDITEICPFLVDTLTVLATGGTGIYTYRWTIAGNSNIGIGSSLRIQPSETTTYRVIVRDQCGLLDSADVVYTITSPPLLITVSSDLEICPGDDAALSVSATGGFGNYFYDWIQTGQTSSSIVVNPFSTTTYIVEVSDDCQTFSVPGSINVTVITPDADFAISSTTVMEDLPITFQNLTLNAVSYQWYFGDGQTSTLVNPNNTYAEPGLYDILLVATDDKGCIDSTIRGIRILSENFLYVPNAFTPDGDRFNNVFKVEAIGLIDFNIQIYNRWGELIFESDNERFEWDGSYYNNKRVQDGIYNYVITYSTPYEIDSRKFGHVNVLR